jgi:hypothetical protein
VCGCAGFVEAAAGGSTPNAIIADYTDIHGERLRREQFIDIGQAERNRVEAKIAKQVADELMKRIARTPVEFEQAIERGYLLAQKMSWDAVAGQFVVPGIKRAVERIQRPKVL